MKKMTWLLVLIVIGGVGYGWYYMQQDKTQPTQSFAPQQKQPFAPQQTPPENYPNALGVNKEVIDAIKTCQTQAMDQSRGQMDGKAFEECLAKNNIDFPREHQRMMNNMPKPQYGPSRNMP